MELTFGVINEGFSLCDVELSDFAKYNAIARTCYEKDLYLRGY